MTTVDTSAVKSLAANSLSSSVSPGDYVPGKFEFRPENKLNVPFAWDRREILPGGRVYIPAVDAYYRCFLIGTQVTMNRPMRGQANIRSYYNALAEMNRGNLDAALNHLKTPGWHCEIYREGQSNPSDIVLFQHPDSCQTGTLAGTLYAQQAIDREASYGKGTWMHDIVSEMVQGSLGIVWSIQTNVHPNAS